MAETHEALTRVFREEAGHLTAALIRILGNFEVAEEIVQDSLLIALEHWPREGIPERPAAWLLTVARRRALNQLGRDARYRERITQLEQPVTHEPDDRLRLMFTCCHPTLSRAAQVTLTLRAICGFTTTEIAHAFLVSETAVAQRLARARRKIVAAHIPYRIPTEDEQEQRVNEVLAVLYLMFNEGYLASSGTSPARRDLAEDASWLAGLLVKLLPGEPEPLGLLALMRLHLARTEARFTRGGEIVLLAEQNRSNWDHTTINQAISLIEQAAEAKRPGPYQLEAAIAACHAEATSWATTDWQQIVILYDLLLQMRPSPVIRLNRAVALRQIAGPEAALTEVNALAQYLDSYHLFHAIRGELLLEMSHLEQARAASLRALELTHNPAEQALLGRRLREQADW